MGNQFEVSGKYNVAKIFTDNIEPEAVAQIISLCNQRAFEGSKIRIMPDVHAGKGCTIGNPQSRRRRHRMRNACGRPWHMRRGHRPCKGR